MIGGSGLLKTKLTALQGLTEEQVATPHGPVFLRTGRLPGGAALVFVQRHDARPSRAYTQPADINYPAIALALKAKVGFFSRRRTARASGNRATANRSRSTASGTRCKRDGATFHRVVTASATDVE